MAGVAEAFVTVRPDMNRFPGDLKSGLGKLTKVAAGAGLAIGAAITGAAVAGLREWSNFERGMNEVFTLLPGISEAAMGQMQDDVRDFSVEMGVATEQVVPALYQALSAGVPEGNVFEFLEIATQASIGGITDLETAVNGITSVVNNYGEDVVDAQKASDLMFTTVRLGKTDFEQLSASIGNVLPFAASAGVEFEGISAAMALMTARTGKTAESSTQLRALMVELSDAGSNVGEVFSEVAGESFKDFMAGGGDMADVMEILQDAAADSDLSIDQLFGSVEAGAAALLLSGENLDVFRANLDEMGDAAGATQEAHETMDTGISRAMERIGSAWGEVKKIIGEELAPALQGVADWVVQHVPEIRAWFQRLMDRAAEMGEALKEWWEDDAKPAVDEFVAAVQDNWPRVESIFKSLGDMMETVGSIFGQELDNMADESDETSGSITSSVENILTVLDEYQAKVSAVAEAVELTWGILAGAVKGDATQMSNTIDDLSGGALVRFEERSDRLMREAYESIKRWLGNAYDEFERIREKIGSVFDDLGGILRQAGRDIIGGLLGGMREKWEETRDFLMSLGGQIRDLKGPIEKDRVLLDDIGQEIIGGLGRGMQREWANIERMLGTITAEIPVAAAGGSSGSSTHLDDFLREVAYEDAMVRALRRAAPAIVLNDGTLVGKLDQTRALQGAG